MERKALQYAFWQGVSFRSTFLAGLGVFSLFAPFGFLVDIMDAGRHTPAHLLFLVALSGVMSVGYFLTGTRRMRWSLLALIAFQTGITYWGTGVFPRHLAPLDAPTLRARLI